MFALFAKLFGLRKDDPRPVICKKPATEQLPTRPLNPSETEILRIVEEEYGEQNLEQDLSFTPAKEAHLVIRSSGKAVTAIHLTGFAHSFERGEVTERELRDDWIRDSHSMLRHYLRSNPSLFGLASRGREVNLVFIAGARKIEIWDEQHHNGNTIEYVLYADAMRNWDYPFNVEPLSKPVKEEIVGIVTKLLEANARAESSDLNLVVRTEW